MQDPPLIMVAVGYRGHRPGPDDLFHVSAGNRSGEVLGRGVLAQYGQWLGGAVAAETHAGAYFAGGALPPAVLQAPAVLTQEQADGPKGQVARDDHHPGTGGLALGLRPDPVVSNAEKAQLVESRQWNAAAVAMMLGIPLQTGPVGAVHDVSEH